MENKIEIKEIPIEEAIKIQETIPEFDENRTKEIYEKRYGGKEKLIIAAYVNYVPVGFSVWYKKFDDGSIYLWMAGVSPQFRRQGIFRAMLEYGISWAKSRGYKSVRIKTRNHRREMLSFLVENGYNLINIEAYPKIEDNRVEFIKFL
jgi:ribosomal protein S18 acetylase RimI-like enzyme